MTASDLLIIGYTPFDRETQQQEMEAIIAGDYKFEPGTSAWIDDQVYLFTI